MWPVSGEFAAAVRRSHRRVVRLDVHDKDGSIAASTDKSRGRGQIFVLGGQVDVAASGEYRRRATVSLVDRGRVNPVVTGALLDPLAGREFSLARGIALPAGDVLVPLGRFLVDDVVVSEQEAGTVVTVSGVDRMGWLTGAQWRSTWRIADGTDPNDAIVAIVNEYGKVDATNLTASDFTLPRQSFGADSSVTPAQAVHRIAAAAGLRVYYDQMGALTTAPVPDPASAPLAMSLIRNGQSIRLRAANRSMARSSVRNGVVVTSNAPWLLFPVRAEVWDTDPASPSYYDPDETDPDLIARMAPPQPERIVTSMVSTEAQALAMAQAKFHELRGIEEQVDFQIVPHPAIDADDLIEVQSDVWAGQTVPLLIESYSIPLDVAGAATITARRRRR